jgi:CRISPR-associated protein Cmr6
MAPPRDRDGRRDRGNSAGGRSRTPDWSELTLPHPARERIADIATRPGPEDNLGLWLQKLVFRPRASWKLEKAYKTFALEQLIAKGRESNLGKAATARHRGLLKSLHAEAGFEAFEATTNGRLLVDFGAASAVETSVSFHPTIGVVRIPGTALKGVTRAHMVAKGESPALLKEAFGEQDRAGQIAFYDALPVDGKFALALDVMTPHHTKYYADGLPPGDWENPVPVSFLTVVDTTFLFSIGAMPGASKGLLAKVRGAFRRALKESGVGAKTAAGYGRFVVKAG